MATDAEELTVNFFEGDQQLVKELDKLILTRGAWATILFRYQDWDTRKGAFGPDKFSIRRYQKRNGEYVQKSKFNISSAEQARGLIEALQNWIGDK